MLQEEKPHAVIDRREMRAVVTHNCVAAEAHGMNCLQESLMHAHTHTHTNTDSETQKRAK